MKADLLYTKQHGKIVILCSTLYTINQHGKKLYPLPYMYAEQESFTRNLKKLLRNWATIKQY